MTKKHGKEITENTTKEETEEEVERIQRRRDREGERETERSVYERGKESWWIGERNRAMEVVVVAK